MWWPILTPRPGRIRMPSGPSPGLSSSTTQGVHLPERHDQTSMMAQMQNNIDFPPAPKLDPTGRLDPSKANERELAGERGLLGWSAGGNRDSNQWSLPVICASSLIDSPSCPSNRYATSTSPRFNIAKRVVPSGTLWNTRRFTEGTLRQ
jgi:hypothetical protein